MFFLKAFAPNAHSLRKEEEADLKNKQTNKEKMQAGRVGPGSISAESYQMCIQKNKVWYIPPESI